MTHSTTEAHEPSTTRAHALAPLLASVAREVSERRRSIVRLERRLQRAEVRSIEGRSRPNDDEATRVATAELASQRRSMRGLHDELKDLGCALERGPRVRSSWPTTRARRWRWTQGEEQPRPPRRHGGLESLDVELKMSPPRRTRARGPSPFQGSRYSRTGMSLRSSSPVAARATTPATVSGESASERSMSRPSSIVVSVTSG